MRGSCSPEQRESCPLVQHFSDTHHLYYPASDYSQGVSKVFRELEENKVQLCRNEHNEIHATQPTPIKPERAFMLQAIGRQLTKDLEALDGQGEMAG